MTYCPRCIVDFKSNDEDGNHYEGKEVKSVCPSCEVCAECEHMEDCEDMFSTSEFESFKGTVWEDSAEYGNELTAKGVVIILVFFMGVFIGLII